MKLCSGSGGGCNKLSSPHAVPLGLLFWEQMSLLPQLSSSFRMKNLGSERLIYDCLHRLLYS